MRALALAAVCLALASSARAFERNAGGGAGHFLSVGAGARALGMGEAFGPVAEGPEAIYWNPAGLAQVKKTEFSYTRAEFQKFLHHDFAALAQPVPWLAGTMAVSYTRLSQESIPVVTNGNQRLGYFSPHSDAIAVGYARSFFSDESDGAVAPTLFGDAWRSPGVYRPDPSDREPWAGAVMVGASFKYVSESYYDEHGQAFVFDGGAIFRPIELEQLSLSFAFRNVGGRETFVAENESLPAELDFGAAYDLRLWNRTRWLPALEVSLPYYGYPTGKIGLEVSRPVGEDAQWAVRGGYKSAPAANLDPMAGLTVGTGVRWKHVRADFGFEPMADLGQVFRLTIGYGW